MAYDDVDLFFTKYVVSRSRSCERTRERSRAEAVCLLVRQTDRSVGCFVSVSSRSPVPSASDQPCVRLRGASDRTLPPCR